MWPTYDDIIERAGSPDWYWKHGMPRYGPFTPRSCGIYDRRIAYLEIACQDCGQRFNVAISTSPLQPEGTRHLPTADSIRGFHYGDPPRHGCIGDTMNVDTLRVIEFWQREAVAHDWTRRPEFEFRYPDGQWGKNQSHD
jgi:hypothetical protein